MRSEPARSCTVAVVHPDAGSLGDPRRRFVADVLQTNGLRVVPLVMADDMPFRASAAAREHALRRATRQIAAASCAGDPVALLAWGVADMSCLDLARRGLPAPLAGVVLIDPRAGVGLRATDVPTLIVNGARPGGYLPIPRPHERALLPRAAPSLSENGAHEAIACVVLHWLGSRMPVAEAQDTVHDASPA